MINISDKSCREYGNTFMSPTFFLENLAVYENVEKQVETDMPHMTI
jgi:hypothetical protein